MNANELENELERLLDQSNIVTVLGALCSICAAKSNHIRENWQDQTLARAWHKAAVKFSDIARHSFFTTIS